MAGTAQHAAVPHLAQRCVSDDLLKLGVIRQVLQGRSTIGILLGDDDLFGMFLEQVEKHGRVGRRHDLNGWPRKTEIVGKCQAVKQVSNFTKQAWMKTPVWFFQTNQCRRLRLMDDGQ